MAVPDRLRRVRAADLVEQDGEQYIGVASGWGGDVASKVHYLNQGGSMWVFKLHKPAVVAGR